MTAASVQENKLMYKLISAMEEAMHLIHKSSLIVIVFLFYISVCRFVKG